AAVLRSGDLLGLADEQLVERGAPHRVHEREQTGLRDLHAVDHREHELAHRERQRIFHGQLLLLRLRCGFLVHGDSWSRGPLLGRTDSRPDSESPLRLHDFNNARDIPGAKQLKTIIDAADELAKKVVVFQSDLEQQANAFGALLAEELRTWKVKDEEAKRTIETKRQELETQGVRLDMAFIQKLAADEASH